MVVIQANRANSGKFVKTPPNYDVAPEPFVAQEKLELIWNPLIEIFPIGYIKVNLKKFSNLQINEKPIYFKSKIAR